MGQEHVDRVIKFSALNYGYVHRQWPVATSLRRVTFSNFGCSDPNHLIDNLKDVGDNQGQIMMTPGIRWCVAYY